MESAEKLRRVVEAATAILDRDVVVEGAGPAAALDALFPEERRHLESGAWAPARQREFAAARACARRALGRLGVEPCALVPNADRSPRWPSGITGSITHTRELCLVALAPRGRLASLGVDVESLTATRADIEALVCAPAERRWLDQQAPAQRERNLLLLFSAKESFYKCQYPLTRTFLDFREVEVAIDIGAGAFTARIVGAAHARLPAALAAVRGRWLWLDDLVITAATLRGDGEQ